MILTGAHVPDFDFAKPLTLPDLTRGLFNTRAYDSMAATPVGRFEHQWDIFRVLINFTHPAEAAYFSIIVVYTLLVMQQDDVSNSTIMGSIVFWTAG